MKKKIKKLYIYIYIYIYIYFFFFFFFFWIVLQFFIMNRMGFVEFWKFFPVLHKGKSCN